MITDILTRLGLGEEEMKTYLFILENGQQTAGLLAQRLGFPRPSLYGYIKRLVDRGLVLESIKNGVKVFTSTSTDKIKLIFDQQIEALKNDKLRFEESLPELIRGSGKALSPKFQLFEGKENVKNVIRDTLLYKNLETESYWPIKTMIEILGSDFFRYFNKERIKRNISIRAIWPEQKMVDVKKHPYLGVGDDFLREIRIAPKEINFEMGYWIYDNKVSFVSSKKESFGFIIESAEFAKMMKTQFDMVWKLSKTLEVDPEHTKSFLKEVYR